MLLSRGYAWRLCWSLFYGDCIFDHRQPIFEEPPGAGFFWLGTQPHTLRLPLLKDLRLAPSIRVAGVLYRMVKLDIYNRET